MTTFATTPNPRLPRLAWIARISRDLSVVQVLHGTDVEVGRDYAVEGVWTGRFRDADFQNSLHFFGSGIRVQSGMVWLVPSRALVDRIVYCVDTRRITASNSLPLLLAATGGVLEPTEAANRESFACLEGLFEYESVMSVASNSSAEFHQAYYFPVRIDREAVSQERSEGIGDAIETFEDYESRLTSELQRLADNARDPARSKPLHLQSTISSGYDSAATTALTAPLGLEAAFTRRRSNSTFLGWLGAGAANDDGTQIANVLGVRIEYLEDEKDIGREELEFLSATAAEAELAFHGLYKSLRSRPAPSVVFTGYHGDKLWSRDTSGRYLGRGIIRGDTSGLNLGEARLSAGFVNVPIPFIFAREVRSIVAISRSNSMLPWSVGGLYDRPIPRRILESRGVPRELFGTRKRAVVQYRSFPVNRELRLAFLDWLHRSTGAPAGWIRFADSINRTWFLLARIATMPLRAIGRGSDDPPRKLLLRGLHLSFALFRWSLEERIREFDAVIADSLDRGAH